MATLTPPFTLDELLAELRMTLVGFAYELRRFYNEEGARALLGMAPTIEAFPEFGDSTVGIDMERFELTNDVRRLYRYAYEGRSSAQLDWSVVSDDIHAFVLALEAYAQQQGDEFYSSRKLRTVLDLALARSMVAGDNDVNLPAELFQDGGGVFGAITLKQMALLAGVDEKTIRNAASGQGKNRLTTRSVKGRTYVDADVAKAWLTARGQWIDIEYEDRSAARDLERSPFWGPHDVLMYADDRLRAVLGALIDSKSAMTDARVPSAVQEWLGVLDSGSLPRFDIALSVEIARFLQVDERKFAKALLKLVQDAQRQELEDALKSKETAAVPS